jgi:hypothetical protein
LAAVYTVVTHAGGSLRFVFAQNQWLEFVRSNGLDEAFLIEESVLEAVRSFDSPEPAPSENKRRS